MSELTDQQMDQLRAALEKRHAELARDIREDLKATGSERYADLAGEVNDSGDESVADQMVDINAAMIERELVELKAVEGARKRMEEGDYGDCIDCGVDIPFARLFAYPAATRCIACQSQREKTYAQGRSAPA
ncbi:MAG: TraR/DksA family transcriptional regulator [bacterium]